MARTAKTPRVMIHNIASIAMIRSHSSPRRPNTRSVLAAATSLRFPSPAPSPKRPPLAADVMVCTCWKPPPVGFSHTCIHVANLAPIYGLNLNIMSPMSPAAPTISISFEKSPLLRKEITRKVTKNIMAVPKSPMIARHPRQNTENSMNMVRFFFC